MTRTALLMGVAAAAILASASYSAASAASYDSGVALPSVESLGQLESDAGSQSQNQLAPQLGAHRDLSIEDFVNADKNHDGYLSRKEFQSLASMVNAEHEDSDALARVRSFKKADSNHDGKISAVELGILGAGAG